MYADLLSLYQKLYSVFVGQFVSFCSYIMMVVVAVMVSLIHYTNKYNIQHVYIVDICAIICWSFFWSVCLWFDTESNILLFNT